MPLNTQIVRAGKPLQLRWGDFHVAAMTMAAALDQGAEKCRLWENPTAVFEQLEASDYPDTPLMVTQSLSFQVASYGAIGVTPLNDGRYVLTHRHAFVDASDGEVLELLPGDMLVAFRG